MVHNKAKKAKTTGTFHSNTASTDDVEVDAPPTSMEVDATSTNRSLAMPIVELDIGENDYNDQSVQEVVFNPENHPVKVDPFPYKGVELVRVSYLISGVGCHYDI
jgi:hypothetical protein